MRILHTSDWHLGARLGNQDRVPDQFSRLEEICGYIDQHEVDLLLVAGDVFDEHRSEPLARLIGRLARLLKPRIEAGLTAVFIAGNHDREHVFPLLRGLQELVAPEGQQRVIFTERPELVPVQGRSGEALSLVLLPYPTPVRYDLADEHWPSPEAKRRALAEGLRYIVDELAKEASRTARRTPVVLCGHFLIRGVTAGLYQLTEQEDVPVEPSDIPAYAYVALGHIHKPQQVGSPSVRYCGSLERMDLGERLDSKQALLVEVTRSGLQDVTELPLQATPFALVDASSQTDLETIAGSMNERERTLVALRLTLGTENSASLLQARARELFPRLYGPAEIVWKDSPGAGNQEVSFSADWRDAPRFIRQYLESRLAEDPEREELTTLADELIAEEESR